MRTALISALFAVIAAAVLVLACVQEDPQGPSMEGVAVQTGHLPFEECPPHFDVVTDPDNPADRNGDGRVCELTLFNGKTITIDNIGRHPPDKKG